MEVLLQREGPRLTVRMPSEVDHPVSDRIRMESDRLIEDAYIRTITFDFQETNFMDSSGIGLIMGRYRALGMQKGCIRAVHVSPYIDKLLRLSGVHRYIEISRQK